MEPLQTVDCECLFTIILTKHYSAHIKTFIFSIHTIVEDLGQQTFSSTLVKAWKTKCENAKSWWRKERLEVRIGTVEITRMPVKKQGPKYPEHDIIWLTDPEDDSEGK